MQRKIAEASMETILSLSLHILCSISLNALKNICYLPISFDFVRADVCTCVRAFFSLSPRCCYFVFTKSSIVVVLCTAHRWALCIPVCIAFYFTFTHLFPFYAFSCSTALVLSLPLPLSFLLLVCFETHRTSPASGHKYICTNRKKDL